MKQFVICLTVAVKVQPSKHDAVIYGLFEDAGRHDLAPVEHFSW